MGSFYIFMFNGLGMIKEFAKRLARVKDMERQKVACVQVPKTVKHFRRYAEVL